MSPKDDDRLPAPAANSTIENHNDDMVDLFDPGSGSPNHREKDSWLRWPKKQYYRYKLMTGVYMLGPAEETVLHFFFFLGAYFIVTYGLHFYSDLYKGGYIEE